MKPYFTDAEVAGLAPALVERLVDARKRAMVPFVITEGLASGGSHVPNSAHGRGLAVDLRAHDSVTRFKMVKALLDAGFARVGVYDKHVHADVDDSLPQGVLWVGRSS
jgi:zinc D-Ala-D-Ala carboxypeptidase